MTADVIQLPVVRVERHREHEDMALDVLGAIFKDVGSDKLATLIAELRRRGFHIVPVAP